MGHGVIKGNPVFRLPHEAPIQTTNATAHHSRNGIQEPRQLYCNVGLARIVASRYTRCQGEGTKELQNTQKDSPRCDERGIKGWLFGLKKGIRKDSDCKTKRHKFYQADPRQETFANVKARIHIQNPLGWIFDSEHGAPKLGFEALPAPHGLIANIL